MNNWNAVSYTAWLLRFRWPVIITVLLLAGLAISGGRLLSITTDYRIFFDDKNPYMMAFDEIERTYTKLDRLLIVVKPNGDDVFTADSLAAIKQLTDSAWQIPYSTRVDSITNFQHTIADGDDLVGADLVADTAALDTKQIALIKSVALHDPALVGRAIATDGGAAGVSVTITAPSDGEPVENLVMTKAWQVIADVLTDYPDHEIRITGEVALALAFFNVSRHDLTVLIPLMLLFLAITMMLVTRSATASIATMVVVILSAATGMGLGGWLGYDISGPSSHAPALILTIAVIDAIHVLITLQVLMQRGMDRQEAIAESMRVNWQPVFLTSLTTVIGFACLNFADAPPFQSLGIISAMGATAAWVYTVTLLPALMSVLPYTPGRSAERKTWSMEGVANFVIRHRKVLLPVMSGVIVLCCLLLTRLEIDDDMATFMSKGTDFRDSNDFAIEHLAGNYVLEYSIASGEADGIADPEYLNHLDALANWLRSQPRVMNVSSFSDVMRRVNRSMHADQDEWYRLPESRDLAAQYLLLYEFSLPYGLDLNNQINVDKSSTRLTVTMNQISTIETHEFMTTIDAWMTANLPAVMRAHATSPHVMFSFIFFENIQYMLMGTAVAFIAISLVILIALRSTKLALLSFVPNLAPTFMAFGIYAIFETEVGLAGAFVAVTALGLIVDATVHFLSKYIRARRENGLSCEDGVRYAFATVGTALWVGALVLIVGFMILAQSTFKINSVLGLLVAVSIAVALVVDFLLLPALLMALDRRPATQ